MLKIEKAKEEVVASAMDSKQRRLKVSETRQRIIIKWCVSIFAILVIAGMTSIVVAYFCANDFSFKSSGENDSMNGVFAFIVAPIASITATTVAFLLGAFRNSNDSISEDATKLISTTTQTDAGN